MVKVYIVFANDEIAKIYKLEKDALIAVDNLLDFGVRAHYEEEVVH